MQEEGPRDVTWRPDAETTSHEPLIKSILFMKRNITVRSRRYSETRPLDRHTQEVDVVKAELQNVRELPADSLFQTQQSEGKN